MRNISDERCRENQNTHFIFKFFFLENRAVYEIMWKNLVQPDRPQTAVRRMRFRATNTHSDYVIVIASPLQQWLHGYTSVLRYACTACLVCSCDSKFTPICNIYGDTIS